MIKNLDSLDLALTGLFADMDNGSIDTAEFIVRARAAITAFSKENNVTKEAIKVAREKMKAEKAAARKAAREADKAAKKAAKEAAKKENDIKAAALYIEFAENINPTAADKAALKEVCAAAELTVAKARNAYNRVYPGGYEVVAVKAARAALAKKYKEFEADMVIVKKYCKAHKLDLDHVVWAARAANAMSEDAAC